MVRNIFSSNSNISLSRTNLFHVAVERLYFPYFSLNSFRKTLRTLISCGYYIKTPKRIMPLYCFGSTITCTQYPKFSVDGVPQILPRPYAPSKPNQKGYIIIRTSWMQSLIKDIEYQVLHYLHNLCDDVKLRKVTLYEIELAKKIIPECLRLGDTCFTHMSVFGTVSKKDGEMPIHYDERDIISCVFHLGEVVDGGNTSYYRGQKPDKPGPKIHSVPFKHGTLQIGFFNRVLHGVDSWTGQRCGLQLNIKQDVLKHFMKYGTTQYDKYRLTGFPQGPNIYY